MFWWMVWALIFIFLIGSDSRDLSDTWGSSLGRISGTWGRHQGRRQSDFEIRKAYRAAARHEVVVVSADDTILYPDTYLDNLIRNGDLEVASDYRIEMSRIAEQQDDDDSMRKYAIYGARIARKRKERAIEKKQAQYYAKPEFTEPTPGRKIRPVVPTETSAVSSGTIDPFGDQPVKPPLWSSKGRKPGPAIEKEPEPSARDLSRPPEKITRFDKPAEPEPTQPLISKPVEPPKPPEPKFDLPDFKDLPPGPVEIGGMPDYEPGPVKFDPDEKPKKEKDVWVDKEGTGLKRESDDDYSDLIDI